MTTHQIFTYWPSSIARRMKLWWLNRKYEHACYEEKHCANMQRQLRDEQRYWQARQALIQSDIRNI